MSMNLAESLGSVSELLNGLADDQRRLLLSILTTFPLGILNHFVYGKTLRLIYSLFFGVCVQYYMYGFPCVNVLIATVICYLLIKICDRNKIGWIVTVYAFAHLSVIHIYRMIVDYGSWSMDISLIFMMIITKYTSFAFCYSDGAKDEKSFNKFTSKHCVRDFSFLEYFSYIYFYPTSIMGPFFEFSDFRDFINREEDYTEIPLTKAIKEGTKRLLGGLLFACLYLVIKPYNSVDFYFENAGSKYIPNWAVYLSFLFQKFKYYTAFLFTESICVVSGISYHKEIAKEGEAQVENFDKVRSININVTESTLVLSKFFQNWNISIHHWLKRYVHFRIYDKTEDYKERNKAIKAKVITFMISGLWHGFYPSYYIIFTHFSLGILMEENVTYIKKHFNKGKLFNAILDWVHFFISLFACPYIVGILNSLHFARMIKFCRTVYFLPTILILVYIAVTNSFITAEKRKLAKQQKN
jgi:lysophospholipid acyltransferase